MKSLKIYLIINFYIIILIFFLLLLILIICNKIIIMKTFTARQPIFNVNKEISAYEILYRNNNNNFFPTDVDGNKATSCILINSFLDTDIFELSNNKPVLINFSSVSLLKKLIDIMPFKKIYIEILENLHPTEELFLLIKKMYSRGYNFVLDDFIYNEDWDRFFPYIKIVKFDIRITPLNTLHDLIQKLKRYNIRILAEKVETIEEFNLAKKMNFDYFQGFFFSKPEMIEHSFTPYKNSSFLLLYKELLKKHLNYDRIALLIQQDVSIAYKFLKYVNKITKNKRSQEIISIKEGLIYIGDKYIKNFIFLIISAEITINKPLELQKLSLIRSKFLELIARNSNLHNLFNGAALVGMLSVLDSILDRPMEEILEELPIEDDIKLALTNKKGKYSVFIDIFQNYEKANWDVISIISDRINITEEIIHDKYILAVRWADKNFQ